MSTKFALEIGCSDGRCAEHARKWCNERFSAKVSDRITLPGIVRLLAHEVEPHVSVVRGAVETLVHAHGVSSAVVQAHSLCAGNPVHDDEHCRHVEEAVRVVHGWGLLKTVHGILVHPGVSKETVIWQPRLVLSLSLGDILGHARS